MQTRDGCKVDYSHTGFGIFFFFFFNGKQGIYIYIYIYIYTRTPKESQDKAWLNTSH